MDFLPPPSPMRLPAREGHLACSTNQGGAIGISKRRAQRGRLKLCSRGLVSTRVDMSKGDIYVCVCVVYEYV